MLPLAARRTRAAITLLAVPVIAASLASSAANATSTSTSTPAVSSSPARGHFNVGATHSPLLERLLARGGSARSAGTQLTPPKGSVLGIDVASGQHAGGATIDWAEVAAAGYRFAFIKTTEGSYYANPFFASDLAGAKAAGLLVAPYHFANPADSSGTLQADFAVDHSVIDHSVINHGGAGSDGMTLPLIADLEFDPYSANKCYGLTPRQMVGWIRAFTTEVDRLTGQYPVIYTIADWWDKCTGDSTAFAADPLWVASYARGNSPTMPVGWANWTYWQYTSMGKVPGIDGVTDLSALNPTALAVAQPATQSYPAGAAVSLPIRSVNAAAGQALSYMATGLPSGLEIDPSSGLITGTLPTTPGTSAATVTVSGTDRGAATVGFTWNLHGPVLLAKPPNRIGEVGSPWLLQINASDGLPGCTLDFRASGLPPGLTMSPCGQITGWLTKPGSYDAAISVTDSSGSTLATTSFSWQVNQPRAAGRPGQIAHEDKCLTAPSTGISIGKCRPIAIQRWSLSANRELRLGSECLATGRPRLVRLRHCHGTIFQNWQVGSDGALINLSNGNCLTATTVHHLPAVRLLGCDGTLAQRWLLPPERIASGVPGWCASAWPSGQPGPNLRRCPGPLAGTWTAEPDGTLQAGGRCLAVSLPAVVGALVHMERCTRGIAERWQFFNVLAGVQLVSPEPGLCLADPADSRTAPVRLALGYCLAADPGVSWRFG